MTVEILKLDQLIPPETLALLDKGSVMGILQNIAEGSRAEWIRLAKKRLHSSRVAYTDGIQPVKYTPGRAVISLVGQFPNMIENGITKASMRKIFLGPQVPVVPRGQRGGKHKTADGGYYRTIPFRHTVPGSGDTVGTPMDKPYSASEVIRDAKARGRKIHEAAMELKTTTGEPGNKMAYGDRLGEGLAPKKKSYHATDIYSGMIRQEKQYKDPKKKGHQYTTFRRIAVDKNGEPVGKSPWVRKARNGEFIAKDVKSYAEKIAPDAFKAYVEVAK